eukprot:CAMPEP_0119300252 /NCGR_PEP_ID=MMETSP1333-20130426/2223_1 /TAXON_ID=418940 /ORGANISM="Scyphosphaera apsteinii, Strain RCC1455" /LENGTH=224 /DNA_ID=CAMNT_0007301957 /DNA_START=71 /DNA_END=745 /DNA_ORIENTATION=-
MEAAARKKKKNPATTTPLRLCVDGSQGKADIALLPCTTAETAEPIRYCGGYVEGDAVWSVTKIKSRGTVLVPRGSYGKVVAHNNRHRAETKVCVEWKPNFVRMRFTDYFPPVIRWCKPAKLSRKLIKADWMYKYAGGRVVGNKVWKKKKSRKVKRGAQGRVIAPARNEPAEATEEKIRAGLIRVCWHESPGQPKRWCKARTLSFSSLDPEDIAWEIYLNNVGEY